MTTALRFVQVAALGVWLGAMVFFAFLAAPAAFAVLPTREQAGNLVATLLPRLHLLGAVCGVVFVIALAAEQRLSGGALRGVWLLLALVAAALLLIGLNHFWLGERLAGLRQEMTVAFGSVDQTPAEHALRRAFGRLHGISSLLLSANLLLVVALLGLTVRRWR